jgi:peptide/nickel transport system permease protein
MTAAGQALHLEAMPAPSMFTGVARFVRRQPLATACCVFLVAIIVIAASAPLLAPHSPVETHPALRLQDPGSTHLMGTDELGRDVYSRLLYGARESLEVGYGATAISLLISVTIALVSGYAGGAADLVVQRVVDAFISIPALLILLSLSAILKPSVLSILLIIGVLTGIGGSRIVRAAVLATKDLQYVEAARTLGAGSARVALRHVLPNITHVIIISGSLLVGATIVIEATVSFLGFGVPPPAPTWGGMLSGSGRSFMRQAPWMAVAPGVAISLTVLAFNLLGDALRDVLDPRLRGR